MKKGLKSGSWPEGKEIPVKSRIHGIIESLNLPIKKEELVFRPLTTQDIPDFKDLEEEWFPFTYGDYFYQQIHDTANVIALGCFWKPPLAKTEEAKSTDTDGYMLGAIMVRYENNFAAAMYVDKKRGVNKNAGCGARFCNTLCNLFCTTAYIMTIGVIDEGRRLGIASTLINNSIKLALKARTNCIAITLHVLETNSPAIGCYERSGFVHVFDIPGYYNIFGQRMNGRFYVKHIKPGDENKEKTEGIPLLIADNEKAA